MYILLPLPVGGKSKFSHITLTSDVVERLQSALDTRKAPGDDEIPTKLLSITSKSISPCVYHLFRLSMDKVQFPQDWKNAIVTPVYKKWARSVLSNYHPISLLSTLPKVLSE